MGVFRFFKELWKSKDSNPFAFPLMIMLFLLTFLLFYVVLSVFKA